MQIPFGSLSGRRLFRLCPVVVLSLALATAQAQWVSTHTKALSPLLKDASLIGPVDTSTPMHILVGLNVQNGAQIPVILKRMNTPGDPLFMTTYTPEQFVSQFSPSTAQVTLVENYLSSQGFQNLQVEPNRLLIQADGTASQVEAAFNTGISSFQVSGKTVFANTLDAQVPTALSGIVVAVLGLNNFEVLHTPLVKSTDPCTPPTCPPPSQPLANTSFTPWQYQIAYNAAYPTAGNVNANKLKQKVNPACNTPIGSIAEGDMGCMSGTTGCPPPDSAFTGNVSEIVVSGTPSAKSTGVLKDLYLYWHNYQLPLDPVSVVYTGKPSADTSGAVEWDLDSQTSTGIANEVLRYYFYVATSLTDSDIALTINKYASDGKAKLFSISLGECESFPYLDGFMITGDMAFAQAALQGQTTFASSDDNGSACPIAPTNGVPGSGPPDVSYPASSPYVIAVGATDLYTNANYTYDFELGAEFSGGGISAFETSPFWEATAVPSAAAGQRGLPDTAMCGEPNICGAIIYEGSDPKTGTGGAQTCCEGGTSLSSPLAMGAYARIEMAHSQKLGFAGPLIYQYSSGTAPGVGQTITGFNDVVAGPNGLYQATPGWDYVTGLGSWDILRLLYTFPSTYNH
ncbi:MAG: S8/S53 family peptidase [Acidobacteriaceae bacterium]|nr:S8/S53 family peptidase [Acidobacteriaceae bacterium]MBV9778794.1 S8/S53 family peptidase [Acidobacteriaceae bacterium]